MNHSKRWRSSVVGAGFGLLLAAGVAYAQHGTDSRTRSEPPAGTGGANSKDSNFPAAAAATTSGRTSQNRNQTWRDPSPGEPAPQGDPALTPAPPEGYAPPVHPLPPDSPKSDRPPDGKLPPEGKLPSEAKVPSEGKVPSRGWQMGTEGTVIELGELAPVEVIDLQERLQALSLYHGSIDGLPGPQTRQALQQYFIKQAQLALQGQVDASALNLFDVVPTSQTQPL